MPPNLAEGGIARQPTHGLHGSQAHPCAGRSAALAGWTPRATLSTPPEPALNTTIFTRSTRPDPDPHHRHHHRRRVGRAAAGGGGLLRRRALPREAPAPAARGQRGRGEGGGSGDTEAEQGRSRACGAILRGGGVSCGRARHRARCAVSRPATAPDALGGMDSGGDVDMSTLSVTLSIRARHFRKLMISRFNAEY